jgi:CheY-like chemotaxis protein
LSVNCQRLPRWATSLRHGFACATGGGIEIKSAPGQGTTFRTFFPAAEAGPPSVQETGTTEAASGGEHILIVDDEPAILGMLQRILESRGFRVTAFTSSNEALAGFREAPDVFDAIITDQTMPRMSGVELARAVHELRPSIPVVLTTGYVDDAAHRERGRDIAGVMVKPFEAAAITVLLRNALDRT